MCGWDVCRKHSADADAVFDVYADMDANGKLPDEQKFHYQNVST